MLYEVITQFIDFVLRRPVGPVAFSGVVEPLYFPTIVLRDALQAGVGYNSLYRDDVDDVADGWYDCAVGGWARYRALV